MDYSSNSTQGKGKAIQKLRSAFKIIFATIFILLVAASFFILWQGSREVPVQYEIHTVNVGEVKNATIATGKIMPRKIVSIKPQISGTISEIKKEVGEHISKGDVIATVNIIPEMSALSAAQARVELGQINFDLVKKEHERQKTLFEKKVIAKEEMDKANADYQKARVELKNARDNLNIARSGVSGNVEKYSNTYVRSTINGRVLEIPVKVGSSVIQANTFHDGTTVATIADMSDMLFIGNLDETEINKVHEGMPVEISIGALEDRKLPAKLEYVSPHGVESNGAIIFEIKAPIAIPKDIIIRSGYSANAELVLNEAKDVLIIPESTLNVENGESFVYILQGVTENNQQEFVKQVVETGLSDGVNVEIKSGLEEGQEIRGHELPVAK